MATTKPKLLFPFTTTEPTPQEVWEKIDQHWDTMDTDLHIRIFMSYLKYSFEKFNKTILTVDVRTFSPISTTVSKLLAVTPVDDIVNTLTFWKYLATEKHLEILHNPDLALDYIYTVQDPLIDPLLIESKDHLEETILKILFNNIEFRGELEPVGIPPLKQVNLNNIETEEDTDDIPF